MTAAIVFAGPTLSADEVRAALDAVVLPPAAQGDVYRAALGRPRAIGLIDGYFERVPAVSHKEILWAMSRGVHVFGAASMGALRAAELSPFGMVGVGEVFEALRRGELEDDDEVAVAHGPAAQGYRAGSEAMVNIRRTLRAAEAQGLLGEATAAALTGIAKALYYPDRIYPAVLARGAAEGLPEAELGALQAWLPGGRMDQKRLDALAMLRAMREGLAGGLPPKEVSFTFEHTDAWERIQAAADALEREGAVTSVSL